MHFHLSLGAHHSSLPLDASVGPRHARGSAPWDSICPGPSASANRRSFSPFVTPICLNSETHGPAHHCRIGREIRRRRASICARIGRGNFERSEEHTPELQSRVGTSYAVF